MAAPPAIGAVVVRAVVLDHTHGTLGRSRRHNPATGARIGAKAPTSAP
jgi:hypothetical protein